MIKFNIPPKTGKELEYIKEAIEGDKICGDGPFTFKCQKLLEEKLNAKKVFLTTSGTSALEMACVLGNIGQGDEVIMSSFTFSSTANAFILFGAKAIFVDIEKDTMNINPDLIEAAITSKTKAICLTHYAGVGCDMDKIVAIAKKHNLLLIEDAAQVVNAKYKDKYLGTIGDIGCFSFHETKNYSMGEGGAIIINRDDLVELATIIREKGTDRTKFINGQVDKYTWVYKGGSYLPSDILAAYLYPQLLEFDEINNDRIASFNLYYENLKILAEKGYIELPTIPYYAKHNAHMFYIKCKDILEREKLQSHLRNNQIQSAFHYIPLHSCKAGEMFGEFRGEDLYTTKESERLLRLPMYYKLNKEDVLFICEKIQEFYGI